MVCYFDIETDGLHRGARITCAATWSDAGALLWHSNFASYMKLSDLTRLIDFLCQQSPLVTFNGANFDFRVLYYCTLDPRVLQLAKSHIDICLCFGASKGYFGSLDSFMQGCNIPGKSGCGGNAIDLWLQGSREDKVGILNYCKNDVRCLKDLYVRMIRNKMNVYRQTKSGRRQKWIPKLDTVDQALKRFKRKPPDTKWMASPPKIDKVLDWMREIPPLALQRYSGMLHDTKLHQCARAAGSLAEFDCMVAEEVYAALVQD